jgi:uncharacterized membrane protein YqjE
MESDAPPGAVKQSTNESLRQWIASLGEYLTLKLKLFGVESKEAALHLLVLALLFGSAIALFSGFLMMLLVFLLYLMTILFHWEWGWSALACAGLSLSACVIVAIVFRFRITRTLFPVTLSELKKDREWLTQKSKSRD